MDNTQLGILALMKSAVLEEAQPLPAEFDIASAYPYLKHHHIIPIAYDGAVRCGIPAEHPQMQKLFQDYCKSLLVSERQMREVTGIFAAFEKNGIDYMPLKGCRLKSLYPKPELRMMGDADILIRMEQYGQIRGIMESLGYTAKADTDHELVWVSSGLYVELHKRLIPSYNEDLCAYFGEGWQLASQRQGSCCTMTPEDEFIFLFTHFTKHFRDGGIGCRYVADLWLYLRSHPGMQEDYIRAELEKLHLLPFYANIRRLISVWFDGAAPDEKTEYISQYIFASGSWGDVSSRVISAGLRDMERTEKTAKGKLKYILRIVFPSVQTLRYKYTVLQKAPFLLPVVWLGRPFYKLLYERETLVQHKENLASINQENTQARRQLLHAVGLDYHMQ